MTVMLAVLQVQQEQSVIAMTVIEVTDGFVMMIMSVLPVIHAVLARPASIHLALTSVNVTKDIDHKETAVSMKMNVTQIPADKAQPAKILKAVIRANALTDMKRPAMDPAKTLMNVLKMHVIPMPTAATHVCIIIIF